MNFETAKKEYRRLNDEWRAAGKLLGAIPGIGSGPMGLTPDAVRNTPEFQQARAACDKAAANAKAFNTYYNKVFKKEIAAERAMARAAGFLNIDAMERAGKA